VQIGVNLWWAPLSISHPPPHLPLHPNTPKGKWEGQTIFLGVNIYPYHPNSTNIPSLSQPFDLSCALAPRLAPRTVSTHIPRPIFYTENRPASVPRAYSDPPPPPSSCAPDPPPPPPAHRRFATQSRRRRPRPRLAVTCSIAATPAPCLSPPPPSQTRGRTWSSTLSTSGSPSSTPSALHPAPPDRLPDDGDDAARPLLPLVEPLTPVCRPPRCSSQASQLGRWQHKGGIRRDSRVTPSGMLTSQRPPFRLSQSPQIDAVIDCTAVRFCKDVSHIG
jgi:hypothetical protein